MRRIAKLAELQSIPEAFAERIRDGYLCGNFQFATDSGQDNFLRRGVFSCYQPVNPGTPLTENPTRFHPDDYYLTYHRWATRRQIEICYPQFRQFLAQKLVYDRTELFQSDWYAHHKTLLS